jgi:hypothetical protein
MIIRENKALRPYTKLLQTKDHEQGHKPQNMPSIEDYYLFNGIWMPLGMGLEALAIIAGEI